jgi:hypothetical protein
MTIGLINAGGTPGATTFYRGDGQWSVPVGTKTETLAEVLGNGNTSGANNIVMADSQKITFGASGDLEITHDTSNSYINTTSGSAGDLFIDSQGSGHDLYLQAADDVFIRPQGGQDGIKVIGNSGVELYGYNLGTSAMNKAFYVSDQGSGSVRSVAEKGLSIKVGSNGYGLLQYSTQGAGNNRGGIEIYGGNESYGKRMFIGSAYIQGTTSSSPGFGLAPVVEFFPTNNPEASIASYQFTNTRAFMPSLKVGDTEITGNLTVDGQIIHGGGGGSHSGKGGTFTGSRLAKVSQASAPLFSVRRPVTGAIAGTVTLTSGSTGSATTKIVAFAFRLNMTEPPFNTLIDCTGLYPYTTGSNYFTFDLTGGGDGVSSGFNLASATTNSNILTFNFAGPGGSYAVPGALVTSPTFTFPTNTRVASVDVDSATVTLNQNVTVASNHQIKFDTSDILIFRVRAYGVDQQISYTFDLGYDENTVATVSTATNS